MTVVVVLALAGLIALVAAVLTGNTAIACIVIAFAILGMFLLVRDWWAERSKTPRSESEPPSEQGITGPDDHPAELLRADMFKPDISTDPDGPSSDARAD